MARPRKISGPCGPSIPSSVDDFFVWAETYATELTSKLNELGLGIVFRADRREIYSDKYNICLEITRFSRVNDPTSGRFRTSANRVRVTAQASVSDPWGVLPKKRRGRRAWVSEFTYPKQFSALKLSRSGLQDLLDWVESVKGAHSLVAAKKNSEEFKKKSIDDYIADLRVILGDYKIEHAWDTITVKHTSLPISMSIALVVNSDGVKITRIDQTLNLFQLKGREFDLILEEIDVQHKNLMDALRIIGSTLKYQ